MPSVVGDFNQRYQARVTTLRNAQAVAQPTQALDSSSIMAKDIPTVKGLDTTPVLGGNDLNTSYAEVVGYIIP